MLISTTAPHMIVTMTHVTQLHPCSIVALIGVVTKRRGIASRIAELSGHVNAHASRACLVQNVSNSAMTAISLAMMWMLAFRRMMLRYVRQIANNETKKTDQSSLSEEEPYPYCPW